MSRHLQAMNNALKILSSTPYSQHINAIYLYGSCATGKQKYDSDVDLLVEYNSSFNQMIGRQMRIAVIPDNINLPDVELKFVKKDLWKKNSDCFSKNLQKEGILLWKKP